MQSVFHGDVHEMYDLKGSTVGRFATEAEKARGPAHTVLKDMDLQRKIRLGPGRREAFLRQVSLDAAFLERMGIMDYSLLLGIHFRSRGASAAAAIKRLRIRPAFQRCLGSSVRSPKVKAVSAELPAPRRKSGSRSSDLNCPTMRRGGGDLLAGAPGDERDGDLTD